MEKKQQMFLAWQQAKQARLYVCFNLLQAWNRELLIALVLQRGHSFLGEGGGGGGGGGDISNEQQININSCNNHDSHAAHLSVITTAEGYKK